ncbi:hypothetical protein [Macrococcoides canis]|uniref:hypothetical protein n=1 Tax=Macrococcoides canis TaxID=1855823 RepID=UPI001B8D2045|nr:hypothetical protein [Macrococcus canis]QUR93874.1 hypothetical protein GOY09_02430 [Macrococcus canis]
MKVVITGNHDIISNPLLVPSVIQITALKNALVTGIGLLQNHEKQEDRISIDLYHDGEVEETTLLEFKTQLEQMLISYFKFAKVEVTVEVL